CANLVAGMKWLLGTYTGRFNRRHQEFGHLFSGRYKALIVDGSASGYLKTVCDYVHLNPARAKVLSPQQKLSSYRWSSLGCYLRGLSKRPSWLRVDRLLGEHGIAKDSQAGRREFERRMEWRRQTELSAAEFKRVQRGWYLGDKQFREELLEQMKEQVGQEHYGEERAQAEAEPAEGVVRQGLKGLGWKESDLSGRPKGDPKKLKLAERLRAETTASTKWIAERLHMGTWTYLNHLLDRKRRGKRTMRCENTIILRTDPFMKPTATRSPPLIPWCG